SSILPAFFRFTNKANLLPCVRPVDSQGVAGPGDNRPLRAERRPATGVLAVPNFIAANDVPDTEYIVLTDGCDAASVRRKSGCVGYVLVTGELSQLLSGRHVPEVDRLLTPSGHQPFAVRREVQRPDARFLIFEFVQPGPRSRIPNHDHTIVAPRGDRPAIR